MELTLEDWRDLALTRMQKGEKDALSHLLLFSGEKQTWVDHAQVYQADWNPAGALNNALRNLRVLNLVEWRTSESGLPNAYRLTDRGLAVAIAALDMRRAAHDAEVIAAAEGQARP